MKQLSIITNNTTKVVGLIIVLIATGLVIREMIQLYRLPSITDPICEVVDFFKYKQDTIPLIYLWILIFFLGIGIMKRNYFGWVIPQSFLTIGLIPCISAIIYIIIPQNNYVLIIIVLIYFLISFGLVRLFNHYKVLEFFKVSKKMRLSYYSLIIGITIGYYLIDNYANMIIK